MQAIYVCYRHRDAEAAAQRLIRFLANRLGAERVTAAADYLPGPLGVGDWLLLVIGPHWLAPANAEDPLFGQLAAALAKGVRVVPVLLEGAALPALKEVPEALRGLLRRQPLALTTERWAFDAEELLVVLIGPTAGGGAPPPLAPKSAGGFLSKMFRRFRSSSNAEPPILDHSKMAPAEEAAPAPAAALEPEPVLLGAAAPAAVKPGSEFTAHFAAYVAEQEGEVRRMLEKRSPRSISHLGEAVCCWRHGTHVRVRLRARTLLVDPEEQDFVWVGGRTLLAFDMEVPEDAPEETVVLKFDVLIDELVVARLRMDLVIGAEADENIRHTPVVEPARTAFASYSSADRSRVLDRVDALTTDSGIRFFMDCLDLHQGEEWKPALAEAISRQDLFVLFWSQHSAASPWVGWELDTAKAKKSREFIQVQALQPGLNPPAGFEEVHCNSVYLWVREGNEAVAARHAPGGGSG